MILFFLAFCFLPIESYSIEIKGDTSSRDGYKIIRVWGSHYDRGYAYGYLLGEQIVDVLENYLIKSALGGQKSKFDVMKSTFINYFEIDEKYSDEGQGILDGMIANGEAAKLSSFLGREIDKNDILCGNIIVEFAFLGCSSLALWGDRTEFENLIYTRNLDWDRSEVLLRNHLLTVHLEQEEDNEQSWVSFGFPGLIGILSGINFSGVGAFHHMGNYGSLLSPGKKYPIFFSIRNGIELKDYNADGFCNTSDVFSAIKAHKTGGGFIINVVNEPNEFNNEPNWAIVVETDNASGTVYRTKADNISLTGDIIASTNHFRKLYPRVYCSRFDAIEKITKTQIPYSNDRAWDDLSSAAGVSSTLQTIQYIPTEGIVRWALADMQTPAYQKEKNVIYLADITNVSEKLNEEINIDVFPNPAKNEITLGNLPDGLVIQSIEMNDINGNKVNNSKKKLMINNEVLNTSNLSSGIYFLKITGVYKGRKTIFIEKVVIEN